MHQCQTTTLNINHHYIKTHHSNSSQKDNVFRHWKTFESLGLSANLGLLGDTKWCKYLRNIISCSWEMSHYHITTIVHTLHVLQYIYITLNYSMHTHTHAHVHMQTHADRQTYTCRHTHTHTHVHTCKQMQTHAYMHTIHTYAQTNTHTGLLELHHLW